MIKQARKIISIMALDGELVEGTQQARCRISVTLEAATMFLGLADVALYLAGPSTELDSQHWLRAAVDSLVGSDSGNEVQRTSRVQSI